MKKYANHAAAAAERRSRLRHFSAGLACLLALPVMAGCSAAGKCPAPQWKGNDNMILIDTRTPDEYADGHLRGAILIPHDRILAEIGRNVPDRSAKIVLYCRSGRRAETARAALLADGYTEVENFGGMAEAAEKLKLEIVR